MKKILIIGSAYAEIVTKVKSLPKGNEDFETISSDQTVAGDGYIMARFIEHAGLHCDLISTIGQGTYGDFVYDQLKIHDFIKSYRSDELNGCTLRLVDLSNQVSYISNPGEEFEFYMDSLEDIYPDEYDCVVVTDEILASQNIDDLLYALEDMELPIYAYFSGKVADIDEAVLNSFYALEPIIYISDSDLFELLGYQTNALEEAAKQMHEKTNHLILISQKEVGTFSFDGEELFVAPCETVDSNAVQYIAYIIGVCFGIDKKNALMFACDMSEDIEQEIIQKSLSNLIVNI